VCGKPITNRNAGAHKNNCENKEIMRQRMRDRNPMRDPGVRDRATREIRRMMERGEIEPYGGRNHGNGSTRTKVERRAHEALKDLGFMPEFVIGIGRGKWRPGLPKNYRIDLANPEAKIAIELDGGSHSTKTRRERDQRKDRFLKREGWKVIRLRVRDPATFDPSSLRRRALAILTG